MANAVKDLLNGDPAVLRDEVARFVGPNADKFLPALDAMRDRSFGSLFRIGFCWPAFFVGPVWFLYRKLWWCAALYVVFGAALNFVPNLPHQVGLALAVALGWMGRRLYVTIALERIAVLRRTGRIAEPGAIESAGGVSKVAGWIGGVVYFLFVVLSLVAIVMAMREGAVIPT